MKWLVVDFNSLLYANFYGIGKKSAKMTVRSSGLEAIETAENTGQVLALQNTLLKIATVAKQVGSSATIIAMDSPSWRKEFSQREEYPHPMIYKSSRNSKRTPQEKRENDILIEELQDLEAAIRDYTNTIVMKADGLEADDIIAGICQTFANEDLEIDILTSDSDLYQCLTNGNVTIINARNEKGDAKSPLEDYKHDPAFYLFSKIIRGDRTDDIASACPRIRSTKIEEAYEDAYKHTMLMESVVPNYKTGEDTTVRELFKYNEIMIDLSKQPPHIRELIDKTINEGLLEERSSDVFAMMRYFKSKGYVKALENIKSLSKYIFTRT